MKDNERIAAKLGSFHPSFTLELKRIVAERAAQGLPVYDFGLGETKGELPKRVRDAGIDAFREGRTQYGDSAGLVELREAALQWLGLDNEYTPDHVVVTIGAKQSLFNVFLAVCNPGDTVLFDAAPWVSYQPQAAMASTHVAVVQPAAGDGNYLKITPADLRKRITQHPAARLFLINSPVNPTSQLYSAEELDALLQVCVEHGIYFVLDRLYWRLVFDGADYSEPRVDEDTKPWLIQIDGISKNFRRTGGLRIGWSIGPKDVSRAMVNVQSHYTSHPALPTQHAAVAAISCPYDVELRTDLQRQRDLLHREARQLTQVKVWPTPAAFYSFWDVRALFGKKTPDGRALRNSDDVAGYLLREGGVVTASGQAFMQDGYLRLSFATPDDHIVNGVAAAAQAIEKLTPR